MDHLNYLFLLLAFPLAAGCSAAGKTTYTHQVKLQNLTDSITKITAEYPAEIGVAAIFNNNDTLLVNNRNIYPMMSVFKMHQAVAVCNDFDRRGDSLDSILTFSRADLDPNTWSPMLKDHPEDEISLPVSELLRYTLTQSDNNASNLMFDRLVNVSATDSLLATLIPRSSFRIAYTEHEMSADHARAYTNSTSPLGAAILINRLFNDSLVSRDKQQFITRTLGECTTGQDRIIAPLLGEKGVTVAHKTGSGYSEKGILAAHNDVAYIVLPDSSSYSLAIFVKDFKGDEKDAAASIGRISQLIYNFFSKNRERP